MQLLNSSMRETRPRRSSHPKMTIYWIAKRLQERGITERKQQRPRKDKIHMDCFLAGFRRSIKANLSASMFKLAKECRMSNGTIQRAVKDNLGPTSYCLRHRHLLTKAMMIKRLVHSQKILSSLKATGGYLRFFSDEKLFDVDQAHNHQNNRWVCSESPEVPANFSTKQHQGVTVFGIVSLAGHIMDPHFFSVSLKINTAAYLDVLHSVVRPWMEPAAAPSSRTLPTYLRGPWSEWRQISITSRTRRHSLQTHWI